jgi:hypothetical protein
VRGGSPDNLDGSMGLINVGHRKAIDLAGDVPPPAIRRGTISIPPCGARIRPLAGERKKIGGSLLR